MSSWNDVLNEINQLGNDLQKTSPQDRVRRAKLAALASITGRNTIIYYSGWLEKPDAAYRYVTQISDSDKNGFMACFHSLDFSKGLDLIIHSPGGDVAATESIIDYLRSKFGHNIRTIVPQISMSGGTMLALAGYEIWMGRHSNLGPIDPQFGGMPAVSVLDEFQRAYEEIKADPDKAAVWRPILEKYHPTFLTTCEHAIKWSEKIGREALVMGMFRDMKTKVKRAERVVSALMSLPQNHAHNRHIHRSALKTFGLRIKELEADQAFQDAVLSVHHATIITLSNSPAAKIIENDLGIASIRNVQA